MKANIDTVIVGSRVVLVPYRPEHVPVRGRPSYPSHLEPQSAHFNLGVFVIEIS